jgi:hypothetical protein
MRAYVPSLTNPVREEAARVSVFGALRRDGQGSQLRLCGSGRGDSWGSWQSNWRRDGCHEGDAQKD